MTVRIKSTNLQLDTLQKAQLFDLTAEVKAFLAHTGIKNGIGVVSTLHTTTGLFLSERQDALWHDVDAFLRHLIGEHGDYKHNDPRFSDCDRHNAAAHLRAILLGGSLTLQVEDGHLMLGQFQRIIFAELDGPRSRSVRMQFMGEGSGGEHADWRDADAARLPSGGESL